MQTVASLVSTVQDLMEELKISATTALDNRILGSLAIPSSTGVPVLQTTEVYFEFLFQVLATFGPTECVKSPSQSTTL